MLCGQFNDGLLRGTFMLFRAEKGGPSLGKDCFLVILRFSKFILPQLLLDHPGACVGELESHTDENTLMKPLNGGFLRIHD